MSINSPYDKLEVLFAVAGSIIMLYTVRNPSDAKEIKTAVQIQVTNFLLAANKFCELSDKYGSNRAVIREELNKFAKVTHQSLKEYGDKINGQIRNAPENNSGKRRWEQGNNRSQLSKLWQSCQGFYELFSTSHLGKWICRKCYNQYEYQNKLPE